MRTYTGVDYHRGFSYMTAMDETGKVCARGRVANDRDAVRRFVRRADQVGCGAAVQSGVDEREGRVVALRLQPAQAAKSLYEDSASARSRRRQSGADARRSTSDDYDFCFAEYGGSLCGATTAFIMVSLP
jgi:hypothetical protein